MIKPILSTDNCVINPSLDDTRNYHKFHDTLYTDVDLAVVPQIEAALLLMALRPFLGTCDVQGCSFSWKTWSNVATSRNLPLSGFLRKWKFTKGPLF